MTPRLVGVIPAVPTPVGPEGEADLPRLVALVRDLFEAGCHAVNLLGTTGEATSFDRAARLRVMEALAKAGLAGRMMVGTGAAALADAVVLTQAADSLGFAGALLLPPFYYTGITGEALCTYVQKLVAQANPGTTPLYLYNIPQFTGVAWPVDVVGTLSERLGDALAGLKDSSGDLAYAAALAGAFGHLSIFPSDEATLRVAAEKGYAGCISASVNVRPRLACAAYAAGAGVDEAVFSEMVGVRKALTSVPLVPAVKAAIAHQRQDGDWARMKEPLAPLSPDQLALLLAGLAAAGTGAAREPA